MSEPNRPVDDLFKGVDRYRNRYKSHELLVYLHPSQFLELAEPLPESPSSIDNIVELTSLMRGGTQMDDVPYLLIDEFGRIKGHEGRHRANAIGRMGYEKMPVRLMSNNFANIRWSQQADPNNFDYIQRLPDVLISEDGNKAMEVPFETEGPRRGMTRPEYADSTAQNLPRPSREWEGQSVRGWDYESRMLPEFGSEEFHNAAHRTKIKVEARAMFDRDGAELSGFDKRMHDLRGVEAYEDQLYSLYREPQFRNIEVGFIEQTRKADGQPFDIFWEDDRFDLQDLAEEQGYWRAGASEEEIASRRQEILQERSERLRVLEGESKERWAQMEAEELEKKRMLAQMTPEERDLYDKKELERTLQWIMGDIDETQTLLDTLGEPNPPQNIADVTLNPPGAEAMPPSTDEDLLSRQMEDLFTLHDEQAAEVRRLREELETERSNRRFGYVSIAEDRADDLEWAKKDLAETQERLRAAHASAQEGRARAGRALEERYASTVREPFIEEEVYGHEMETRRQEGKLRRGEVAERVAAYHGKPSLDDLLRSEGIPRESFLDFMELPENRRPHPRWGPRSIPELIEAYKIAGELPASAGVPSGRSYPLQPLSEEEWLDAGGYRQTSETRAWATHPEEPVIHAPYEPDPHNIGSGPSRENYRSVTPPEMTPQQRASIAQDPETGLRVFTPTDVEAEWTGRPLSDEDVLARGVAPKRDLLEGSTLAMDPETGDFRPVTPSGERQMIVGGSNIPERQMVVPGGNVPESYWIESAADALNLEPGQVRDDIRSQADFYKELLRENRTPAIAFDDPIMRAAYEIAEAEVDAERLSPTRRVAAPLSERQPYVSPEERTGMARREDPQRTGISRRQAGGGTEATQGILRAGASMEPEATRVYTASAAARPAEIRQKATVDAQRLLELLRDPDIDTKIAPGQQSKLRVAAARLAPVLETLGNVALAAELGYFVGQERDVGRGLMSMGASNIEGTGTLLQLPQMGLRNLPTGYEQRAEQGLLTPPEVAAEGLAAVGRGVSSLAQPYRREQQRRSDRAFIARNTQFQMDMNPTITEDEARTRAIRDLRTIKAAPPGGYPQQIPTGTQQRALLDAGWDPLTRTWGNVPTPEPVSQREQDKQRYMDWLVDQGYMKWGTGRYEGALLQGPRTRQEGGYPSRSDWEAEQSLAGGM